MSRPQTLRQLVRDAFTCAATFAGLQMLARPFPGGMAGQILEQQGWSCRTIPVRCPHGLIEDSDFYMHRFEIRAPNKRIVKTSDVEYLRAVRSAWATSWHTNVLKPLRCGLGFSS